MQFSASMTGEVGAAFASHLLRDDGQEDLCFAPWSPSTGSTRTTAIVGTPVPPTSGDRHVHGNASFEPEYALRAAHIVAKAGKGLAFAHSHPGGRGWQDLNAVDQEAEARIANLAREVTGLPLVGLTLAGDHAWSARVWDGVGRNVFPRVCHSVRVIGEAFGTTFNNSLVPIPTAGATQVRTIHTWGESVQAKLARLRVAVAGVGSVGMIVAETLARSGVECVGVFDFDTVELVNMDRLRGAGRRDAYLGRSKTEVAHRLLQEGSTAKTPRHEFYEFSVCEPEGLAHLLDFDLVFSCVDRPWPRHVLNTIAYADQIPVIEGGLRVLRHPDGSLRNAYWRSTVVRPGRPCFACLGPYDPAHGQLERDGSLDDPSYIAGLPRGAALQSRENVAAFSVSVAGALLQQFISYVVSPSGIGDPGPLRFSARDHTIERDPTRCQMGCPYQASTGGGDARLDPTARHAVAEQARRKRHAVPLPVRAGRAVSDSLWRLGQLLDRSVA